MTYENIIYEVQDSVATITFNRPKALNALNSSLFDEFSDVLDKIESNEIIRVLILTGAGEKAFVAGADIKELALLNPLEARFFSRKGQKVMSRLQEIPIPVIAAVNGYALGGGMELALSCDFIYAADNATFGLPEITLGLIPGFGGTQRLSRLIGLNRSKEMIFTGRMIPAHEALQIGMVNALYPFDALMSETMKTARAIASRGRVSLGASKSVINRGSHMDLPAALEVEADNFSLCMTSKDAQEGMNAFIEKRAPLFKGSWKD